MGLDTTHDCWHGAYSAFMRWRSEIARAAGGVHIDSDGRYQLAWHDFEEKNYYGEWDTSPSDPLTILLAHSDCEGVIKAADCSWLADRLEALLPRLNGDGGGHIGSYRDKTQQFIAGLRTAAQRGEDVEFH
jgi:hypothetical protein